MKLSYFAPLAATDINRRASGVLAVGPGPVADLRHVFAVLADIARMLDQGVAELLFDVSRGDVSPGTRSMTSIAR